MFICTGRGNPPLPIVRFSVELDKFSYVSVRNANPERDSTNHCEISFHFAKSLMHLLRSAAPQKGRSLLLLSDQTWTDTGRARLNRSPSRFSVGFFQPSTPGVFVPPRWFSLPPRELFSAVNFCLVQASDPKASKGQPNKFAPLTIATPLLQINLSKDSDPGSTDLRSGSRCSIGYIPSESFHFIKPLLQT